MEDAIFAVHDSNPDHFNKNVTLHVVVVTSQTPVVETILLESEGLQQARAADGALYAEATGP